MGRVIVIRNSAGDPMAAISDGKCHFVAEHIAKHKIADLMLAMEGWSGALQLARRCITALTVEIYTYLDLLKDDDFVQAYVDARTLSPELQPSEARWLVVPYWLLATGPHAKPEQDTKARLNRWLQPPMFSKRGRLTKQDLVALAHMGVEHMSSGKVKKEGTYLIV